MEKRAPLLLALSLVVLACNNQGKDSVEQADSANTAKMDSAGMQAIPADENTVDFLVRAADGGMAEVNLSQMAQQKGMNARVKDLSSMLIHDHTAANDQVKSMASQRNVTLPDSVSTENKRKADDLMKKSGRSFDKSYVSTMVNDHEKTIDLFEDASKKVNDAEVKTFIDNTLPKLRMHLDSARVLSKILK